MARHNQNHNRRKGIVVGELILICAGAWVIAGAPAISQRLVQWNQNKPVSWLLAETHLPMTETAVAKELWRRFDAGLTQEEITLVASRALEIQRDRQRRFDHEWGDIIECAQHDDLLPPRLWEQYVRQVVEQNLSLRVPAEVRRGQPIEVELVRPRMIRTGEAINIAGSGTYALFVDDKDVTAIARQEMGPGGRVWAGLEACQLESVPEQWRLRTDVGPLSQMNSGPHKLRLKASLEVIDCQDAHPQEHRRVLVNLALDAEVTLVDSRR